MRQIQRNLVKPSRQRLAVSLAFGLAIALTVLISHSLFNDATAQQESDGATVRISALKSESGAVRVALQQQPAGGAWGERQHPDLNTVRADHPTGVWLNSSPLFTFVAEAESDTLFCVISHGTEGDYFWRVLKGYVRQAERDLGVNVRYFSSPLGAEQAVAIEQCAADGAAAIAATLADPPAVTDSLLAAKAAGARIVTYNSGIEHAEAAGAELHLGLDDYGAGRLAAETFNERGVSGTMACLIHEAANVGLESRCDALEETYHGPVIRLRLPESQNSSEVTDWIKQRLLDPDEPTIHAMLALNAITVLSAFNAVVQSADQMDHAIQIGTVGGSRDLLALSVELRNRHLLFVINNMMEAQGYLITAALTMVNGFHQPPSFILKPLLIAGTPFVYDSAGIRSSASAEDIARLGRNTVELLALSDAEEDD